MNLNLILNAIQREKTRMEDFRTVHHHQVSYFYENLDVKKELGCHYPFQTHGVEAIILMHYIIRISKG